MPNLAAGTIVSQSKCACCGRSVQIKLNKNGNAYYYCPWATETGDNCAHHERWGKSASQLMQRNYLAARQRAPQEPANVQSAPATPANIPDKPSERPEPATGGADAPERGTDLYDYLTG